MPNSSIKNEKLYEELRKQGDSVYIRQSHAERDLAELGRLTGAAELRTS